MKIMKKLIRQRKNESRQVAEWRCFGDAMHNSSIKTAQLILDEMENSVNISEAKKWMSMRNGSCKLSEESNKRLKVMNSKQFANKVAKYAKFMQSDPGFFSNSPM
jgi:hypothetical protein